jgi:hypothetical protein
MKFKYLKAGKYVFVVHQRRRGQEANKTELREVVKVGRKYGYIEMHGLAVPFSRETGESVHHPDSNARGNSRGFDVYMFEQEWLQQENDRKEHRRLAERIVSPYSGRHIVELQPTVVAAIHKILDDEGIERKDTN